MNDTTAFMIHIRYDTVMLHIVYDTYMTHISHINDTNTLMIHMAHV